MASHFVCIHGHFYQPPRENPWSERVEAQESAAPFHDWNQRISAECYTPNLRARVLDAQGRERELIDNYERISFNFGPTLLSWLERVEPETYRAILAADAASAARFGGHGSAIAQAYGHAILPLCNARDKRTQVRWGLADFRRRFGRAAEGMWLPETAVDTESLEALAESGVRFTVLAPAQAARIRRIGEPGWRAPGAAGPPACGAYRLGLPSGREIALFFYDGEISSAIAFGGLLHDGDSLFARLTGAVGAAAGDVRLVHVATDGETYGHHHRHGEMALARALTRLARHPTIRPTNYAEFLARFPPTHEAQVVERSAWSCPHELGRWSNDCGCASGELEGQRQAWRAPLRESLDWLRDAVNPRFEERAARLLVDPWEARDAYVDVVLERSRPTFERFLAAHARGALDGPARLEVLRLLELQRHLLLMYTSCGWFFDDVSRIETIQILQYAARALELAETLFGTWLEGDFLRHLEPARSNVPEIGNARHLWQLRVHPSRTDPRTTHWLHHLAP